MSVSRGASSAADSDISSFSRAPIRSETRPDVTYRLERAIARGGFAVACLAERIGPDGSQPVVLKIMRPAVVTQSGEIVMRLFKKEVVALGRLNERVPPTPFVVRMLDTGTLRAVDDGLEIDLPWIAIEYVHGGVEGETLSKRVRYAMGHTGSAFDPVRAANVLSQLAAGLSEIHAVEVIHRDLKPSNVLCCGFGPNEMCKISDFGIARPTGLSSTFGKLTLGSPGYVAPEQIHLREEIGPRTDVFSLAAIVYWMLGGERYFDVSSAVDGVFAAMAPERKSLLDAKGLSPELADRPDACRAIDAALVRATAPDPRVRFESAEAFARAVLPWLTAGPSSGRASQRLVSSVMTPAAPLPEREPARWHWATRKEPGHDVVITGVAWDSDGHFLAATPTGLSYWDGASFTSLTPAPVQPIHCLRRVAAGRWLLASDAGRLLSWSGDDAREVLKLDDPRAWISACDGDLEDLAVMVVERSAGPPELRGYCGRHWLKPLPMDFAASVPGIARLGRERWLVCGRSKEGGAFAAVYRPLDWGLEVVMSSTAPAFVSAASQPALGVAVAVGGSEVVRVVGDVVTSVEVAGGSPLSACDVDLLGGQWFAGAGRVLFAASAGSSPKTVWQDPSWTVPFVSLYADAGRIVAVTVEGAVLEGRNPTLGVEKAG